MLAAFWAARQPDVAAIVCEHGDRTFAELNANANKLTRALRARGVGAGDSLGFMMANRPEFAEVVNTTLRAGLRMTTINWHLTGEEAGYILDDCEAKVFVADARFAAAAREAATHAPGATVLVSVGGEIDGFETYESLIADEDGSDIPDPEVGSQMLYTSGTTGRPKGVNRPRSPEVAKLTAAAQLASPAGYVPGESVNLCTGPLYHAAPLAFSLSAPLAMGATVVLMDGWSAAETLELMQRHKVTHTHMVPTMFHRLLSLPADVREAADVSSVHYIIHGAAPCPVSVKKAIIEWFGPVVHEYYAATEGAGTTVDSHQWLEKPGTVGKPPTPDHIRILDEEGNDLPPGEIGTVFLKAPPGRFEYYKDPAKTESSYRDTHYTLGDVGYLDEDGFLFLTDRSANLIISGGVNVYPAEVEAELIAHPAVGDVAVIGVPDEEWGEKVVAVIEPQPDVEPTPELAQEIIAFAREHLAHYKCPRQVDFRPELPRHDNGKLYKRLLRDEYRAAAQAEGGAGA
ncbi:AMP-binding protein [Actinomarinicola tropica]|uniref:AMP-binding protein n=2 Tax=Actinomarinicola tropica TaxID=2789776 RepID=A0A5Q2RRE2_9ACTN|nr:AMP-binding protein [Actinomarinicola tropica]